MAFDLVMPKLGLTMTEGSVSEWKVVPGDAIKAGDVVLVVETDKVAHDIEAERDGVMLEIVVAEGETVPVGTVLARIDNPEVHARPQETASLGADAAVVDVGPPAAAQRPSPAIDRPPTDPTARSARIVSTPLARKQAIAAGVDLATVAGSGPGGRIKAADVQAAALRSVPIAAQPSPAGSAIASRRRPSATQAAMARWLSESKHGVPHFYLASEAEVSALEMDRAARNAGHGRPHLTLTAYIVAAVGRALADIPEANTVWADGEFLSYATADVGIAVDAPQGLYAPVLRDAGTNSLDAIARESRAMAERARAGALSAADMAGGAITVSNAGMHNVTWMSPIIAPGQSAILGVGSVRQVFRPDQNGRPALRLEMGLVLAADHRVFDGVSALALLNRIIEYLQTPKRFEHSHDPGAARNGRPPTV